MIYTDRETFENLVAEGINKIPKEFREKFDNVVFFVEDLPSPEQRRKIALKKGWSLFGLYEGIPLTKRNSNYSGVMPDKITLFKQPIEYYAQSEEHLKMIVRNTVWHEVGHYFGMNEHEVRRAEKNRGHIY